MESVTRWQMAEIKAAAELRLQIRNVLDDKRKRLLKPNNTEVQRFLSQQLVLKWVKGSEICWHAVKKPAAVQIISAFHYCCLFDGHAANCAVQIPRAHFWSRPIRSPNWGVRSSGRSGTLQHGRTFNRKCSVTLGNNCVTTASRKSARSVARDNSSGLGTDAVV